jgi:SAM-dependent methyltransferase
MPAEIYRDGRHFDLLYGGQLDGAALAFWGEQARLGGGPVLELACGTGRLTVALARDGHAATGLDQAPSMLAEARRRAAEAGVAVAWVQADMVRFELGRRFGLIILTGNSLCHLLDLPAIEGCLASVRRHLAPGGRFVIDVFVPDPRLLARDPGERYAFGQYEDPDGRGLVVVTASNRYEPDTQINRIRTEHRYPGAAAPVVGRLDLRMYYPQELHALLTYNGLPIERKLADYDGTPFGPDATRQIIICRADGRSGHA